MSWTEELREALQQFQEKAQLQEHHIFVIGCSTSEVIGETIGTAGTMEVAQELFAIFEEFQKETGVQLAFQCCEHLNRALVVSKQTALLHRLEEVTVVPIHRAGGALATVAYQHLSEATVVEYIRADGGMDIGDTFIGMHLKHVAVPIRTTIREIGKAHVTFATTRPKLIGGARAVYLEK